MSPFAWLLVGHLLGDWMFQNDWIVQRKQRGLFTVAIALHCSIYTVSVVGPLWFTSARHQQSPPYFLFALLVYVSHWLIDATDAAGHWVRLFRQSDRVFVRIMVDQSFHLLVLALLAEFLLTQ